MDLRTDYRAGFEFSHVETQLITPQDGMHTHGEEVAPGQDFTAGARIAAFPDLPPGLTVVETQLRGVDGDVLARRRLSLTLSRSTVATIVIARSCAGVQCPDGGDPMATECFNSRCVRPICDLATAAETCEGVCTSASDCAGQEADACARVMCVSGACFAVADDTACEEGLFCDPEAGCRRPPGVEPPPDPGDPGRDSGLDASAIVDAAQAMDAGPADAGEPDSGAPPFLVRLAFTELTAPFESVAPVAVGILSLPITALASDGTSVYAFRGDDARVFTSTTGATWTGLAAPPADFTRGSPGDLNDGALTYVAAQDSLVLANCYHADPPIFRLGIYDITIGSWTLASAPLDGDLPTHALVTAGDFVFGIGHALGSPLRRVRLGATIAHEGSRLSGAVGDEPTWYSRVAKLAVAGGWIYGIKNDRGESGATSTGNRLYRFDPSAFVPAGDTPIEDLGPLPFDPGVGSAIVALPAGWGGGLGSEGGLMIFAGEIGADGEGLGTPSRRFVVYDLASSSYIPTDPELLPSGVVLGRGSSATFHGNAVFVLATQDGTAVTLQSIRPAP